MKKIIGIVLWIFTAQSAFAQFTVNGVVMNHSDQTPVEGAVIYFPASNVVTISDSTGYFQAKIKEQQIPTVTHVAFQFESFAFEPGFENSYGHLIIYMQPKNNLFEPVVISDSRAGYQSPVTYTNISGADLNKNNFGEDMPLLLEFTPSAVVTSDAGNGVGYTGIRIRGTDATRVNVTINGVPYNDAESQQTYWVDLPDIASSVDDIQIQRGVGTSSNGISSLGGAININTNSLSYEPFASAAVSTGSFNLLKASASFGTGELNDHWFVEGRLSKLNCDGFIDRSFSDLTSFFLTGAYRSKNYSSIVNIFSGEEHTYQSWGGVPKDSLETNRTFNPYTYENQTDNYTQTHYQWHNTFYFQNEGSIKLSLNYTKGKGFYEQLEEDQYFSDYNVADVIIGADTITSSDFITQKWLDNDFYGAYLNYDKKLLNSKLQFIAGAAFYQYTGDHFGKVIWSEYASTLGNDFEWYRNDAVKNDGNIFTQFYYHLNGQLIAYLDLQMRNVSYTFSGYDYNEAGDLIDLDQTVDLLFFNPKAGISFEPNTSQLFYLSIAKSGKEPNRDDYVESSSLSRPKPEILYDFEAGHKLKLKGWQLQTDIYYMYYIDQLVLNGQINDVGAYTRINVPNSYRAGVEIAWAKTFFVRLNWNGNIALSQNKISEYTEFIDNWDTGEQLQEQHHHTALAFSPSAIASNFLELILFNSQNTEKQSAGNLSAAFQSKFVGRQYIDNTEDNERSLNPYFVNDLSLNYHFENKNVKEANLKFIIQNIFDLQYESNAWVYRYIYEGAENELNGYFPQAGRNYVLSFQMSF